MNVNPMQTQLMGHNQLAQMGLQLEIQRKQQEEQSQRQKELMMLQAATRPRGGGGGGGYGGGGRGSRGEKRANNAITTAKFLDEEMGKYQEKLDRNAELGSFTQDDVDRLHKDTEDLLKKLEPLDADPYTLAKIDEIKEKEAYQLKHMKDSVSGNGLKYD